MNNAATTETSNTNEGNMIKTRKQLRAVANSAGIIKANGISIKVWEDGTIMRNDIRLDFCQPMTVTEAVKALAL